MTTEAKTVTPAVDSGIPEGRPVWARHLRRKQLNEMAANIGIPVRGFGEQAVLLPPTDAEKHDAILVLRDYFDETTGYGQEMLAEAQRIMEECS